MKRYTLSLLVAVCTMFGTLTHAQSAKVIALTPEDAAKIAKLSAQKAEIERQIEEFNKHVTDFYLTTPAESVTAGGTEWFCYWADNKHKCSRYGWNDFEYSTDFKYIVPKATPTPTNTICGGTSCVFSSPAYLGSQTIGGR